MSEEREFLLDAYTLHRAPSGTDARCQVDEIKVKIKITSDDVDAAVKALRLDFCSVCWPEKEKG